MQIVWINAKKKLPPENKIVLLRELKNDDRILKAEYGSWNHSRDGKYISWYIDGSFINYLEDGQYWMDIPELP